MDEIVFVVDDDIDNLKFLGNILRDNHYRVALAKSGSEALEMTRIIQPSLILLDTMIPDEPGVDVCSIIRNTEGLEDTPVILLGSGDETEHIDKRFLTGSVDYVIKPYRLDELLIRISNHISLLNARKMIREQSVELRKLNSLRDQVFAVISHDMKTPLASLQMVVDYLESIDPLSQPELIKETISIIKDSTHETLMMLDNLLNWSKSFKEDNAVRSQIFQPSGLIERNLYQLDNLIKRKKIKVRLDLEENPFAYGDEEVYNIVFRNLLSNALKFSPVGSEIHVLIEVDDDTIYTEIRDHGKGVNPDKREKLFSESDYFSERGTEGEKGTGLGLKICSSLIRKCGGTISINDDWKKGAAFRFSVTVHHVKQEA